MILLTLVSEVAAVAAPAWIEHLHNPFVRGVLVALLTQGLKAIPLVPLAKGPAVAGVAAILSVAVSLVSALASGDLSGFDVDSAMTVIEEAIKTIAAAFGTAEAVKHSGTALTTRTVEVPDPAHV